MNNAVAVAISVIAGISLVCQNGMNTALRQSALHSTFLTSFSSFAVSLVCIVLVAVAHRPNCSDFTFWGAPWYAYCGGLLGPIYVVGTVVFASQLGFAVFQLCAMLGQVVVSLACDVTGFLSTVRRIPSTWRVLALGGVVLGTAFTLDLKSGALVDQPVSTVVLNLIGATLTGAGMPVQALVNGVMGRHAGTPFRGSVVSFSGGALSLGLISLGILAAQGPFDVSLADSAPWMWGGGVGGMLAITGNIIGVGHLGPTAYSSIYVATQLLTAFAFDTVGAFGFEPVPASTGRVGGVLLAVSCAVAYQLAPSTVEDKGRIELH